VLPNPEDLSGSGQVETGNKDVAGGPETEGQHRHAPAKPKRRGFYVSEDMTSFRWATSCQAEDGISEELISLSPLALFKASEFDEILPNSVFVKINKISKIWLFLYTS
jgi:hypothetical protein